MGVKGEQTASQLTQGDSMNVMAQAHKDTRDHIAQSCNQYHYAKLFAAKLRQAHKEYKAMTQAELLKAQTIELFEKRIVELKEANAQYGNKWIVVCGDDHPMPIDFESKQFWSNVEKCTKWASRQFAQANAQKVVNGNNQVGKAVLMADHIEWDIANLTKLINDLKA